ncbi:hypothetical protein LUCX_177 [Xanthomonas phage vB_XciM_LucasX]|nr:hypothetical protein LUCX_177 [Xanthomonas phage vB_XciM_LucasX]
MSNTDFSQGSKSLLVQLVNDLKQTDYTETDLIFGTPAPIAGTAYNTTVSIQYPDGKKELAHYTRLDLTRIFQSVGLSFNDPETIGSTLDLVELINTRYGFGISEDDIEVSSIEVDPANYPVTITLATKATSLAYIGSAEVVILDPEAELPEPPLVVALAGGSNTEEGQEMAFTITSNKVSDSDLVMGLTYGGTAVRGTDYTAPDSVTLLAGQTTVDFRVATHFVQASGSNKTVTVAIAAGDYVVGGAPVLEGVIIDHVPPVVNITGAPTAVEGESLAFTIMLNKAAVIDTQVELSYSGSATRNLDYTAPSSVLIAAGASSASLVIQTLTDDVFEGDETIEITIVTGAGDYTLGVNASATGTILGDAPPVASISGTPSVEEGGSLTFTVSLNRPVPYNVVVPATYSGTAVNNTHYANAPASVTIAAGQTSVALTVPGKLDLVEDGNHSLIATIGSGSGYTVGTASATGTFTDYILPEVTISGSPSGVEGSSLVLTVSLNKATKAALTIGAQYSGTATRGSDYNAPNSLNIGVGGTTVNLTIATIDDTEVESSETVIATLLAGTGYKLGGTISATATITDNDVPPVVYPYNGVESSMATGWAFHRLTGTYTGPLFEITRLADAAVLQVYTPDTEIESFLNGGIGDVTKVYDQFNNGEVVGGSPNMRVVKSQGRWGGLSRGINQSATTSALGKLSGVSGIAAALIISNAPKQQSGEVFTVKVAAGSSTSQARYLFRTKTPLGWGLQGRKLDGSPPNPESNTNSTSNGQLLFKPSMKIIGLLDYTNGYLRIWQDGATTPQHARDTYYTAGGVSSETVPSSATLNVTHGAVVHEFLLTRANLDNGLQAKITGQHAAFFGSELQMDIPDASWTYQNEPMMLVIGNKVVSGSVSHTGRNNVAQLNKATGEVEQYVSLGVAGGMDDHAPVAMCLTPSGKLFATYAGHSTSASVKIARGTSTDPNSLVIGSVNARGTTAYANAFTAGGKTCILTRNINGGGLPWLWELLVSSAADDGQFAAGGYVSWRLVGCPDQFYLSPVVLDDGKTVRFYCFKNSDSSTNAIRVADLNVETGVLTSNGVELNNFSNNPDTYTDYESQWAQIQSPATYQTQGQDRIAFWGADKTSHWFGIYNSTGNFGELYYSYLTNTTQPHLAASWTTTKVCNIYPPAGSIRVMGRARKVLVGTTNPRMIVSNSNAYDGSLSTLEQWDAPNTNGTGVWTKTRTLDQISSVNDNKVCMPVLVPNGDGQGVYGKYKKGLFTEYYSYFNREAYLKN